ncbi:hypothetical protein DFP73DRAFT_524939 [Morchella snyderi]|nr:hypothetical protein DFP73DRAFT_524939 [Morchella snyderi]
MGRLFTEQTSGIISMRQTELKPEGQCFSSCNPAGWLRGSKLSTKDCYALEIKRLTEKVDEGFERLDAGIKRLDRWMLILVGAALAMRGESNPYPLERSQVSYLGVLGRNAKRLLVATGIHSHSPTLRFGSLGTIHHVQPDPSDDKYLELFALLVRGTPTVFRPPTLDPRLRSDPSPLCLAGQSPGFLQQSLKDARDHGEFIDIHDVDAQDSDVLITDIGDIL